MLGIARIEPNVYNAVHSPNRRYYRARGRNHAPNHHHGSLKMPETTKFLLGENDIPGAWYNIAADLKTPLPPVLHPGTGQPIGPADLAPLFPMEVIKQEVATDQYIPIPEEVLDIYRLWRPTPLYRAHRLEKALDLPSGVRLFYKYEGTSPAGSHKPNTAVPQAYYNKQEGVTRIATETGAGQWGSALAMACAFFGLELKVYMVKISYQQKPYRRALMEAWGAQCVPSPNPDTNAGRAILAEHPDSTGSLGIAISEAVEDAAKREDTKYSLGSVLNHVLLHQTVIGQEAVKQMEMAGAWPDVIVGCVGGGSNFAGLTFPFIKEKMAGRDVRIIAAEPAACPTLTRGTYAYDFGDTSKLTPLVKMYTLGHGFVPAGIHAGGLRYHGAAPLVSHLLEQGLIEAVAVKQRATFEAAITFGRSEGIIPAPESAHAIRAAIDEANLAKSSGESKNILIGLSGHGNFDLSAYDAYLSGSLEDYEHPQAAIDEALADLPLVGAV
jgi:tryptophan synthase beta chain